MCLYCIYIFCLIQFTFWNWKRDWWGMKGGNFRRGEKVWNYCKVQNNMELAIDFVLPISKNISTVLRVRVEFQMMIWKEEENRGGWKRRKYSEEGESSVTRWCFIYFHIRSFDDGYIATIETCSFWSQTFVKYIPELSESSFHPSLYLFKDIIWSGNISKLNRSYIFKESEDRVQIRTVATGLGSFKIRNWRERKEIITLAQNFYGQGRSLGRQINLICFPQGNEGRKIQACSFKWKNFGSEVRKGREIGKGWGGEDDLGLADPSLERVDRSPPNG